MKNDPLLEIHKNGYCVLESHCSQDLISACREGFWPILLAYLDAHREAPNRGAHRHFLPMPFTPPCFAPEFFFDNEVLRIVHSAMDTRVVADQWGCDAPVRGSVYQSPPADHQRPLFHEQPDLVLPTYMLVVSFALVRVTQDNGPIEIAPGTHSLPRKEALRAVEASEIAIRGLCVEARQIILIHPGRFFSFVMCAAGMPTIAEMSVPYRDPCGPPSHPTNKS